jgi:hypothetical protein
MPQLGAQCLNEVDLDGLQKTLIRGAGGAPVGQQIEVPISRLDKGQPHQCAAFDAGHFDAGLKTRAGRRRPGYLQHRILMSQKGDANAAPTRTTGPPLQCPIPDIIEMGLRPSGVHKSWALESVFR